MARWRAGGKGDTLSLSVLLSSNVFPTSSLANESKSMFPRGYQLFTIRHCYAERYCYFLFTWSLWNTLINKVEKRNYVVRVDFLKFVVLVFILTLVRKYLSLSWGLTWIAHRNGVILLRFIYVLIFANKKKSNKVSVTCWILFLFWALIRHHFNQIPSNFFAECAVQKNMGTKKFKTYVKVCNCA